MVKHIKLDIDDEKFYRLKSIKSGIEFMQKKDLTWEDFLVSWVLHAFEKARGKTIEEVIDKACSSIKIKEEHMEEFRNVVESIVQDKLRFYSHTNWSRR